MEFSVVDLYKIFGVELSPYSVKVRSYFRYKGIHHKWIVRSFENQKEYNLYAKIPIVPLVVTPDNKSLQDSTPLMEKLESEIEGPSMIPEDRDLAFISRLIEEYADEWVNKPLFHYRWNYKKDEKSASKEIATYFMPQFIKKIPFVGWLLLNLLSLFIANRQKSRRHWLGTFHKNKKVVEGSFETLLGILDKHFRERPYLFGEKPCQGDFGLWGQLYNLYLDPTPKTLIQKKAPNVEKWIHRMLSPKEEGPYESLNTLESTLSPLLEKEVAGVFLPWAQENHRALKEKEKSFKIKVNGNYFEQRPIKYQSKSFQILKDIFKEMEKSSNLESYLKKTKCWELLN
ncbi:MAG: enoyl-CoA hydratase [Halobacteriovoraceae bacterium]|nr:enoyl-CoA hydratase [Halobacteriovoraceae bacterium]